MQSAKVQIAGSLRAIRSVSVNSSAPSSESLRSRGDRRPSLALISSYLQHSRLRGSYWLRALPDPQLASFNSVACRLRCCCRSFWACGCCDCPFVGNRNGQLAPAAHRIIDLAAHHRCSRVRGRLGFDCGLARVQRCRPARTADSLIACPQLRQRQLPAEGPGGTSIYLTDPFADGERLPRQERRTGGLEI